MVRREVNDVERGEWYPNLMLCDTGECAEKIYVKFYFTTKHIRA